ncbi:hypothetical protein BJX61DRAFT_536966 [Aspergillus egyptiacus]|nr:hypothetical protein BJX61DRAFT_536966 [Aspergillus egyptiacus]
MDPSSGYTVADIDNHETTTFTAMWQDTIEPQSQPLHFNPPEEILFWDHTPLTNTGLAGGIMPGPAHGTKPPVIDLTEPESSQIPRSSYLNRPCTDPSSFRPSESSHPSRQGETPSTVMEANRHLLNELKPERPRADLTVPPHSRTPSSSRLYKCEWRDCHTPGRFKRELDLVRHLRTVHISPDRYRCGDCDRAFGRKDQLNGHRTKHHESVCHSAKAECMYSSGS